MSQQINLFNPIFLKQKKIFSAAHMAQTLGLVLAGALLLAGYGLYKTSQLEKHAANGKAALAARQARLDVVTREFPPREKSAVLEAEAARMQAELSSLREVQSVLERGDLGNTAGYGEYFRAFARQDLHGVWLTGITIVGAGRDVSVEGRALQPELVPGYLQRLTREAVLQGKAFGSLEIGRADSAAGEPPATQTAPAAASVTAPYVEFRLLSQAPEVRK